MLFVAALAYALLGLLGAAIERAGMDRLMKVNTSKTRQLSLHWQGLSWYEATPNMWGERFNMLMNEYLEMIQEHAVVRVECSVL